MEARVAHIFLSLGSENTREVGKLRVFPKINLVGDRHLSWERPLYSRQEIGLIERGATEQMPFLPQETWRNVVVCGISLKDLVGKEFMISRALLRGIKTLRLPEHGNGIRAEVLKEGVIYVDATVSEETYTCSLCGFITSYPHHCFQFYPENL